MGLKSNFSKHFEILYVDEHLSVSLDARPSSVIGHKWDSNHQTDRPDRMVECAT